ncbi:MAG: hypothetical protein IH946_05895 [Bacteroidetes bacterium]|nr:hypothetical protein [Bacteroidota bacterium]
MIVYSVLPVSAQERSNSSFFSEESFSFNKELISGGFWSDLNNHFSGKQSLGFETLKSFKNKNGSWGSILIQFRLGRYDRYYTMSNGMKMYSMHLPYENGWSFEFHDAYFKYTGNFKGKLKIKLGHFDVPFGLEENEDTHSQLTQLMSMRNLGVKKDYGLSLSGQLPHCDYNLAITNGSRYIPKNMGSYIISSRIGSPSDQNLNVGISGMKGKVVDPMGVMRGMSMMNPMGGDMDDNMNSGMNSMTTTWFGSETKPVFDILERWRIGIDASYLFRQFAFNGEITSGRDINQTVITGLGKIDMTISEKLSSSTQIQYAYQDIDNPEFNEEVMIAFGISYRISHHITLMTLYEHDIQQLGTIDKDRIIRARLYIYW